MDPIVTGSLIGAGANLLGGLFGSSSAKKARRQAQHQFDQQMDYSVQRRVADARKAGIHPLFALGASVGASPTTLAGDTSMQDALGRAGENVARGARASSAAALDRRRIESQIKVDEAQASYYNSLAARTGQEINSRGSDGARVFAYDTAPEAPDIQYGPYELVSPEVKYSKSPGVQAGTQPSSMEVMMPNGEKILVPASDEVAEAFSIEQYLPWLAANGYTRLVNWWRRASPKDRKTLKERYGHLIRKRKKGAW